MRSGATFFRVADTQKSKKIFVGRMIVMRKKFFFALVVLVTFSGLLSGTLATPVSAAPKKIKLTIAAGHPYGPALWVTLLKDVFEPEVNKRLAKTGNYEIEWTEGFGGSIAPIGGVLEAIEAGVADLGVVMTAFEWSKCRLQNLTYMLTFGTDDFGLAVRTFDKMYETVPALQASLLRYNQMHIAGDSPDTFQLFTNFEVKKMEDLKGHKISASGPMLSLIKVAGGVPVEGNLVEWYNMAKTGVIDGVIIFVTGAASFKLNEVLPYYTKVGFGLPSGGCYLGVNKDVWDGLPDEVKKALKESGAVWREANIEVKKKRVSSAEKQIVDNGGIIYQMPQSERVRWANALPALEDTEWAKQTIAEGLPLKEVANRYIELMESQGAGFARDWRMK
jgi:TRAP-type C4-dicarboxylate transport system substrate-binding protein